MRFELPFPVILKSSLCSTNWGGWAKWSILIYLNSYCTDNYTYKTHADLYKESRAHTEDGVRQEDSRGDYQLLRTAHRKFGTWVSYIIYSSCKQRASSSHTHCSAELWTYTVWQQSRLKWPKTLSRGQPASRMSTKAWQCVLVPLHPYFNQEIFQLSQSSERNRRDTY